MTLFDVMMEIDLSKLQFTFQDKPLLIGVKAMKADEKYRRDVELIGDWINAKAYGKP